MFLLVAVLAIASTATSSAGIIFNRHPKEENSSGGRTFELIRTLRHDLDERHRKAAVDGLSKSDSKETPQIAPALVDSMLNDPSPAVRAEAAEALGRIRPMAPQVGMALEKALNTDSSSTVKSAARNSLSAYVHAGYHPVGNSASQLTNSNSSSQQPFIFKPARQSQPLPQTNEPPLANTTPNLVIPTPRQPTGPMPRQQPPSIPVVPPTNPNFDLPKPSAVELIPQPPQTTAPQSAPKPKETKPAGKSEEGPILNPPG
jgi:hypothetical protein